MFFQQVVLKNMVSKWRAQLHPRRRSVIANWEGRRPAAQRRPEARRPQCIFQSLEIFTAESSNDWNCVGNVPGIRHLGPMKTILIFLSLLAATVSFAADLPSRESIIHNAQAGADGVWRNVSKKPPVASSRDLFTASLAYCEAHTNLDRLEKIFDLAASMQDRDPKSKTYGNFLWDTHTSQILDKNAVDFCMQGAAPLWILHRDEIPRTAREKLEKLLQIGTDGQLKHRVNDDYTNIGLMAAVNLILLGEGLGRADATAEGAKRLDAFVAHMRVAGTHEYNSPTYYGVDLNDLVLLESLTKNETARTAARCLLEYFWTDIAFNWFPASQKMGGARSRDYDYLYGLGMLDQHLRANGWLPENEKEKISDICVAFTKWHPPVSLHELAGTKIPRLIESTWGTNSSQWRANYICPDIALSSAGAAYGGRMDLPLCVDFAGDRTEPRGYFIPDGRHDPYGKMKIMEGSGHQKTLHLQPFWAAAQRRADAIGLAVYRPKDLATNAPTLESHFVLPIKADEFWIGDFPLAVTANGPVSFDLGPKAAFVMRRGSTAVGIRVPWARTCDGALVKAQFIYDGNPYGVARVTVNHGTNRNALAMDALPAAAFWVRIGDGLADKTAFEKWRTTFATAEGEVRATAEGIEFHAAGIDGPSRITTRTPFTAPAVTEPQPSKRFLAVDGTDTGAQILGRIPPVSGAK